MPKQEDPEWGLGPVRRSGLQAGGAVPLKTVVFEMDRQKQETLNHCVQLAQAGIAPIDVGCFGTPLMNLAEPFDDTQEIHWEPLGWWLDCPDWGRFDSDRADEAYRAWMEKNGQKKA